MSKKKKTIKKPILSLTFDDSVSIKAFKITLKPRVGSILKYYNIGLDTLSHFIKQFGYNKVTTTSLLDVGIMPVIEKEFQNDKNAVEKKRGKTELSFIDSNIIRPTQITIPDNSFRHKLLYLNHNLFDKPKTIVTYKNLPTINSFFTDIEAINLCSKMSSSYTRNLCKRVTKSNANQSLLIYQIHSIAKKSLDIFGSHMLTFIYGLRNLKFKDTKALEIQTYNYNKIIPDFPIISFKSSNVSFKIAFFIKRNNRNSNNLSSDIRLFTTDTFQQIGYVDERGYVMTKLEKFKPKLTLFYQATEENNFEITSGIETGKCELCPQPLTHPTSLRFGIGPICAKNHNIDRTLYRYD